MAANYICWSSRGLVRTMKGGKTYLNGLYLCLLKDATGMVNGFDPLIPGWTEADFTGYARQVLDYADGATNAAPPDEDMVGTLHTWTCTVTPVPAQTIYGWAVLDPLDDSWIFGALSNRTPTPVIAVAGDEYRQTPRLTAAQLLAYP